MMNRLMKACVIYDRVLYVSMTMWCKIQCSSMADMLSSGCQYWTSIVLTLKVNNKKEKINNFLCDTFGHNPKHPEKSCWPLTSDLWPLTSDLRIQYDLPYKLQPNIKPQFHKVSQRLLCKISCWSRFFSMNWHVLIFYSKSVMNKIMHFGLFIANICWEKTFGRSTNMAE